MESRSCTHSGLEKFTAVHTWVVKDFSLHPHAKCIDGDTFLTMDEKHKWRLWLYPGRCDKVQVFLTAICSHRMIAKAKLWIVDEKKLERNVRTLDPVRFTQNTSRAFGPIVSRKDLFDVSNGLLPDDTLTLCCEVTLLVPTVYRGPEMPPPPTLEQDFGQLLEKQSFSDVILVVGRKEFHVHKAVLAARSPVFYAMFQHKMEDTSKARIFIENLSPDVVKRMVRYLYTNAVEDLQTPMEGLLEAAVRYDLEGLKSLCKEWICRQISTETAVDMFRLADKYGLADLKGWIVDYIDRKTEYVLDTKGWEKGLREDTDLVERLFCSRCEQFRRNVAWE